MDFILAHGAWNDLSDPGLLMVLPLPVGIGAEEVECGA